MDGSDVEHGRKNILRADQEYTVFRHHSESEMEKREKEGGEAGDTAGYSS